MAATSQAATLTRLAAIFALVVGVGFTRTEWVHAQSKPRLIKTARSRTVAWSPERIQADASAVPDAGQPDGRSARATRSRATSPKTVRPASIRPVGPVRSRDASRAGVAQVGYLEGTCGPICDCDECSSAIHAEPVCGIEGPAYFGEPVCGVEGPCGLPGCETCGPVWSDPGCGCEGVCDGGCDPLYCHVDSFPLFLPILRIDWNRFAFFAGTQGFKGPTSYPAVDAAGQPRGGSGSFGYHQGFNEGRSLRPWIGADIAAQFGLRATQSNLQGEEFSDATRKQIFITSGLFRRVDYGLQYGVVVDYLNEDWYYDADIVQLRGELSWKASACHEFGFHWMAGVDDSNINTSISGGFSSSETLEASEQYRAFYRRLLGPAGHFTAFIGGTDQEHLILGSQLEVPLHSKWSLSVGSAYFSPDDDATIDDNEAEGWNLSIGMVFRPGMGHPANRYRRPMFDVADNGSMFIVRKQ
ncbi:MAG: DUF6666 family protein [Planctomycetota bacterium]